jgi:hypothetical protein
MTKAKKIIFPGTALLVSLYISGLFALGIIFGYIVTVLFHKKIVEKGRVKPIFLNFGRWKIHLHHWLMGASVLLLLWIGGAFSFLPKFWVGMIGGLVFHDIYSDREWYKIVSRK